MTGKLPTRYKALGPVLPFSLTQLVRFESVRQSVGFNERDRSYHFPFINSSDLNQFASQSVR